MSESIFAEIRIFAGNFAPRGWALCNGQIMAISQNTALFSLLGTHYGGNGTSNFALPNLQGMAPMGAGQGPGLTDRVQGEVGGAQTVTLLTTQVPQHNHTYTAGSGSRGNVNTVPGNVNSDAAVSDQHLRHCHRRHADESHDAPTRCRSASRTKTCSPIRC